MPRRHRLGGDYHPSASKPPGQPPRFPFGDLDANRAWLDTVCFADAPVRWVQLLCLPGRFANAEPKTMRWQFWHTPARIVRHARQPVIRILDGRPTTGEILAAYRSIELIT
ncbi:MAG: hypothetical protein GY698_01600 [Actinomycetia bacterium]|nr:hypothetical protein [Actinomycetes bacterium]